MDGGWLGFHVFYHEDRDRLLMDGVLPVVANLCSDGALCRFFFIRYNLGGPHVRLRLEPAQGWAGEVARRVEWEVGEFLVRSPSQTALPAEVIRRENRAILANDPLATEPVGQVCADNSIARSPVRFEVERYGGPALLDASVDLFAVSSVEALSFAAGAAGEPAGRRLARAGRMLVRQAWGSASGPSAFIDLLSYGVRFMGEPLAAFVERGDAAFERTRAELCGLLRDELSLLAGGPGVLPRITDGASRLARAAAGLSRDQGWSLAASQLHMTANRLGLLNPEEVYLSRMLWRAAEELAVAEPALWSSMWEAHRCLQGGSSEPVAELVRPSLEALLGLAEHHARVAPEEVLA